MIPNPGLLLFTGLVLLVFQGCAQQEYSVIAATGTTVGVEVGQGATGGLTGVLGYRRAEFALVPSNRPSIGKEVAGTNPDGADETGDVIMELRYSGFSEAGIYQRLAVGKTAVAQPGAQIMFARDAKGNVDANTAKALSAVQGIPVTSESVRTIMHRITAAYGKADAADKERFDAIVNQATSGVYPTVESAALNTKKMSSDQAQAIEAALQQAKLL